MDKTIQATASTLTAINHLQFIFIEAAPPFFPADDGASVVLFIVTLCNRADHYIFALWFLLSFFFCSPNLSHHRLDVCHTSTHGVALVQI